MRKKTVTHSVKTIFWWILYCLPLITYLFALWGTARNGTNLANFDSIVFNYYDVADGVIAFPLCEIFGSGGIIPLFNNSCIFIFMEWFIGTYLLHLAVDFILFIPRLCHKFMNKFTRSEDCE